MHQRTAGHRGKLGFALLAVLIIVAIATTMGLACVLSSTVKLVASRNLVSAARAQYLAESGLQHALYVLGADPAALDNSSQNPIGPFHVDQTRDSYRFWGSAETQTPGKYRLCAQGDAGGLQRTCSYTVFRSAGAMTTLSQGLMIGGMGASLPGSLDVNGDIHNNGDFLLNFARIHGNVTSVGPVMDPLHLIEGEVVDNAEPVDAPDVNIEPYKVYALNGRNCVAFEAIGDSFDSDNPYCGGGAVSPGNLGGVVWLRGQTGQNVVLTNSVDFEGTMIIDGDLVIQGRNIVLSSVQGFPAIVCMGRVLVAPDSQVNINGLVLAFGGIGPADGWADGSRSVIDGGLVADWLGYDPSLRGDHALSYVAQSCQVYDFGASNQPAVTMKILSYE